MARIYLDNAATSWPKPEAVYAAVDRYQRALGAPAGRGAYREAVEVERLVSDARRKVANLLGGDDPRRVIFTANGTDSLNLALFGLLRPGDHVVTSVVEHNSTLRPLRYLERTREVTVTYVACDGSGRVDPDEVRAAVTPRTRLISLIHVSNVTGTIQPVREIGEIARECEAWFLVDAAQSLGHLPVHVSEWQADVVAAPAHKGLLGPLGCGILYLREGVESSLVPLRQGGTGTESLRDEQPESLPERYEAGNLNVPAIVGLGAGLHYLQERGVAELRRHEQELLVQLWAGLGSIRGVRRLGVGEPTDQAGVVAFQVAGYDPQEVAALLDAVATIQVRAGFHCAPRLHAALGTIPQGGLVRMSVGPFTTREHIDLACQSVGELAAAGGKS